MKQVRFSGRARHRLVEIAIWTGETFGLHQADRYESDLLEGVERLARDDALGRPCINLAPGYPEAEEMKYLRVGQHYVIYTETDTDIDVLDFLHGAQNLPALLEALTESGEDQ